MGGLKNLVPFTYSMITIGSLALIGFPFLTGFYSKDLILEVSFGKFTNQSHFSYYLGSIGAFFTAFYSTRLLFLTFLSKPNGYRSVICYAYDSSYFICFSLGVLAIPSIFIGFYSKDMIVGLGTDFWGSAIFVHPTNMNMFDAEFIDHFYKILPVKLSLLGTFSAFYFYGFQSKLLFKLKFSKLGQKIYNFLNKKWFFDKVYNEQIGQFLFSFGYAISYKIVDRGVLEMLGPYGFSKMINKFSENTARLQTGHLYHYTLSYLAGITFLLGFFNCYSYVTNVLNTKFEFVKLLILFTITINAI